jgi:hypothetical protein
MDWTVQNVIDSKDQMKIKVLLSSRTQAPRWGAIQVPRRKRGDEKMKYIGVWEMKSKDMDANIKKYQELLAAREKGSDKFPTKPLSDNYVFTGQYKGFILYDDDTTEEQLVNVSIHFKDTMKWTFKPISAASKTIELYIKSKK